MSDPFDEISETLLDFSADVKIALANSINEAGEEAVKALKATSPKRKGKYARGWRLKEVQAEGQKMEAVIHNTKYRVTHLLEHGHAIPSTGGRVQAFPHIAAVEETVGEIVAQKFALEVGKNK